MISPDKSSITCTGAHGILHIHSTTCNTTSSPDPSWLFFTGRERNEGETKVEPGDEATTNWLTQPVRKMIFFGCLPHKLFLPVSPGVDQAMDKGHTMSQ